MSNITSQMKTGQVNTFTGGINSDLNPILQPKDTLTDCVNGTIITYNGNENMLQNDMGNYKLKNAKLPEGYIPLGMKEYGGIIYLILSNPNTGKVQLGSYPSPQTSPEEVYDVELEDDTLYEISPIKIETFEGDISTFNFFSEEAEKYFYSNLDTSKSKVIFTSDFGETSTFEVGDKYAIVSDELEENAPFQELKYFSINKEKTKYSLNKNQFVIDNLKTNDEGEVIENIENCDRDDSDLKEVSWQFPGWVGCEYVVDNLISHDQDVKVELKQIDSEDRIFDTIEKNEEGDYILKKSQFSDKMLSITDSFETIPTNEIWLELPLGKENLVVDYDNLDEYNIESINDSNYFVEIKFKSPVYSVEFLEDIVQGVADKIIIPSTILVIPENIPTYMLFVNHYIIKLPETFKWVKKLYTPKEIDQSYFDNIVYLTDSGSELQFTNSKSEYNNDRGVITELDADYPLTFDLNQTTQLKSIVLNNEIETLPTAWCKNYLSIEYINCTSVNEIQNRCFSGCLNLREIVLGNVSILGSQSFWNCLNLRYFKIENSNSVSIGDSCFENCKGILYLNSEYNSPIHHINWWMNPFYGASFKKLIIGTNVTTIHPYSFAGNSINEIIFGSNLNLIKSGAFTRSLKLNQIEFSTNVVLEEKCFSDCPVLHSITFLKDSKFVGNRKSISVDRGSIELKFYGVTNFNVELDLDRWVDSRSSVSIYYYQQGYHDFGKNLLNDELRYYLYANHEKYNDCISWLNLESLPKKDLIFKFKSENDYNSWLEDEENFKQKIVDEWGIELDDIHTNSELLTITISLDYYFGFKGKRVHFTELGSDYIDEIIWPKNTSLDSGIFSDSSVGINKLTIEGGDLTSYGLNQVPSEIFKQYLKTLSFSEDIHKIWSVTWGGPISLTDVYFNGIDVTIDGVNTRDASIPNSNTVTIHVPKGYVDHFDKIFTNNGTEENYRNIVEITDSEEDSKWLAVPNNEIWYGSDSILDFDFGDKYKSINVEVNNTFSNGIGKISFKNTYWIPDNIVYQTSLKELNLKNVEYIDDYGLSDALIEILVIPSTVKWIGSNVFDENNLGLDEGIQLYFTSENPPKISEDCFKRSPNCKVFVSENSFNKYTVWKEEYEIDIDMDVYNEYNIEYLLTKEFKENDTIDKVIKSNLNKSGFEIIDFESNGCIRRFSTISIDSRLEFGNDELLSNVVWIKIPDGIQILADCKTIGAKSLYLPNNCRIYGDLEYTKYLYLDPNSDIDFNFEFDIFKNLIPSNSSEIYFNYLQTVSKINLNDVETNIIKKDSDSIILTYSGKNLIENLEFVKYNNIKYWDDSEILRIYSINLFQKTYKINSILEINVPKVLPTSTDIKYELKIVGKNTIKVPKNRNFNNLKLYVCDNNEQVNSKRQIYNFNSYNQVDFEYFVTSVITEIPSNVLIKSIPYLYKDESEDNGSLLIFDNYLVNEIVELTPEKNNLDLLRYQYTKDSVTIELKSVIFGRNFEFNFYKIESVIPVKKITRTIDKISNLFILENLELDENSIYIFEIYNKFTEERTRRFLFTYDFKKDSDELKKIDDYNNLYYDDFDIDPHDYPEESVLFNYKWIGDSKFTSKFSSGDAFINVDSDEIFPSIVCNNFENANSVTWKKNKTRNLIIEGTDQFTILNDSSNSKLKCQLVYDDGSIEEIDNFELSKEIPISECSSSIELTKSDISVPIRQYLIKGSTAPLTLFNGQSDTSSLNNNRFGWSEKIFKYMGYWNANIKELNSGSHLLVEKCDGGKEVKLSYIKNGEEGPKRICSYENDVEEVLTTINNSQLFIPLNANTSVRKSGFAIPVPLIEGNNYKKDYRSDIFTRSDKLNTNSKWYSGTRIFDKKTDVWKSILIGVGLAAAAVLTIVTLGGAALIGAGVITALSLGTLLAITGGATLGWAVVLGASYGLVELFKQKEGLHYETYVIKAKGEDGNLKLVLPLWDVTKIGNNNHPWYFIKEESEEKLESLLATLETHLYFYPGDSTTLYNFPEISQSKILREIRITVEVLDGTRFLDGKSLEYWDNSSETLIGTESNNFKFRNQNSFDISQSIFVTGIDSTGLEFVNVEENTLKSDIGKETDGKIYIDWTDENVPNWIVNFAENLRWDGFDLYYNYTSTPSPRVCFGGNRGDYKIDIEWDGKDLLGGCYYVTDKDGFCPIAYPLDPTDNSILNQNVNNLDESHFKTDIPDYLKYLINYD